MEDEESGLILSDWSISWLWSSLANLSKRALPTINHFLLSLSLKWSPSDKISHLGYNLSPYSHLSHPSPTHIVIFKNSEFRIHTYLLYQPSWLLFHPGLWEAGRFLCQGEESWPWEAVRATPCCSPFSHVRLSTSISKHHRFRGDPLILTPWDCLSLMGWGNGWLNLGIYLTNFNYLLAFPCAWNEKGNFLCSPVCLIDHKFLQHPLY